MLGRVGKSGSETFRFDPKVLNRDMIIKMFEDEWINGKSREYKNSKAGNFQTMLETQMVKVGRFKIMERNRLDEVLSEQGLQGEFSDAGTVMNVGAVDYF